MSDDSASGSSAAATVETAANDQHADKIEQTPTLTRSEQLAQKAATLGHQSLEEFTARGGDPDLWQSPETYLALAGPLRKIRDQTKRYNDREREIEQQFKDLNNFHELQIKNLKAELTQKRDNAIDDFNKEAAQSYQQQIDNLPQFESPPVTQASSTANAQLSQELQAWNSDPKNAWFKGGGPKADYASKQFTLYQSSGYGDAQALELMEQDLNREFPDINIQARKAPTHEGGSKPGKTTTTPPKISMKDLTLEEASIWRNRPAGMWKNEEHFLQSVTNARKKDSEQ